MKLITQIAKGDSGQSTVEYAVVLTAFLAMFITLSLLIRASTNALIQQRASQAASHTVGDGFETVQDVLSY